MKTYTVNIILAMYKDEQSTKPAQTVSTFHKIEASNKRTFGLELQNLLSARKQQYKRQCLVSWPDNIRIEPVLIQLVSQ